MWGGRKVSGKLWRSPRTSTACRNPRTTLSINPEARPRLAVAAVRARARGRESAEDWVRGRSQRDSCGLALGQTYHVRAADVDEARSKTQKERRKRDQRGKEPERRRRTRDDEKQSREIIRTRLPVTLQADLRVAGHTSSMRAGRDGEACISKRAKSTGKDEKRKENRRTYGTTQRKRLREHIDGVTNPIRVELFPARLIQLLFPLPLGPRRLKRKPVR